MGRLVQQHSTVGGAFSTRTETFSAATAGNLLVIVCATNENGGADNITTPTGWTLLGTFRQGTTCVNMAVLGMIAAGGETSQAIVTGLASRMQTWFGEFSGYGITLDGAISTAGNSATTVLQGDTGTATPSAGGRLWLGLIAVKNRDDPFTEVGGFTVATVTNEVTAASTQALSLGVYYDLNRSAAAREQATWSAVAALFGGMGLLLMPNIGGAQFLDRSGVRFQ